MKFLLELAACCGSPQTGGAGPVVERLEPNRMEEARSLMRRSYHRTRRRRYSGSGGVRRGEWRPSLCLISEDMVMDMTKSERERSFKRKNGGSQRDKAPVRIRSRDARQNSVPFTFSTFSATPFMF